MNGVVSIFIGEPDDNAVATNAESRHFAHSLAVEARDSGVGGPDIHGGSRPGGEPKCFHCNTFEWDSVKTSIRRCALAPLYRRSENRRMRRHSARFRMKLDGKPDAVGIRIVTVPWIARRPIGSDVGKWVVGIPGRQGNLLVHRRIVSFVEFLDAPCPVNLRVDFNERM